MPHHPLHRRRSAWLTGLIGLLICAAAYADTRSPAVGTAAPAFTHSADEDWLNSPALRLSHLRGSVVLIDFWAFECWNCYRSFPWLQSIEQRYAGRGLTVIGVHTPELPNEHRRELLIAKVKEYRLHNPIMIDNDASYWRALGNRYWPAFYLVDRKGVVRALFVGETHRNDENARRIEAAIETLLDEGS